VQTILAQQLSWKAASTIHRRLLEEVGMGGGDKGGGAANDDDDADAADHEAATALRLLTPQRLLEVGEARVRSAGVSGAKTAALRDLAQRYVDGRLSDAMLRAAAEASPAGLNAALLRASSSSSSSSSSSACPGASAAAALLAVRGVGPWTLDMVSMFVLGAPDVLPCGDLGVRKGLARLKGEAQSSSSSSSSSSSLPDAAAAERMTASWRPYRTVGAWLMWRLAEQR
jgi:DNA-3-methyladenine glycosylase II